MAAAGKTWDCLLDEGMLLGLEVIRWLCVGRHWLHRGTLGCVGVLLSFFSLVVQPDEDDVHHAPKVAYVDSLRLLLLHILHLSIHKCIASLKQTSCKFTWYPQCGIYLGLSPFPSKSDKWRFIGLPYEACSNVVVLVVTLAGSGGRYPNISPFLP